MGSDEITVEVADHVAVVEIHRPPNNFFDDTLIGGLAEAYEALARDDACRAIVLCSEGKHFCAGANFSNPDEDVTAENERILALYRNAVRMFRSPKPVVAAVQGAAIGGGLGVALSADFRIACEEARFSANFAQLGFHPGFGISVTLPRLIGDSQAALMLYTGRRVPGAEAARLGLADELVPLADVRNRAIALAQEIAAAAPLAVQAIHLTQRRDLADQVEAIVEHEFREQARLRDTEDFREGVAAMSERRAPDFKSR